MAEEYGLIDSDYVFINLWAGEIGAPLRYSAVDALVRRTHVRVGFDFHPHMFRHTFVTVARRHGMSLDVISKAVGHAGVQTTADIYSHLDAEDLRRELMAAGMLERLGDLV
jgi:integrase